MKIQGINSQITIGNLFSPRTDYVAFNLPPRLHHRPLVFSSLPGLLLSKQRVAGSERGTSLCPTNYLPPPCSPKEEGFWNRGKVLLQSNPLRFKLNFQLSIRPGQLWGKAASPASQIQPHFQPHFQREQISTLHLYGTGCTQPLKLVS